MTTVVNVKVKYLRPRYQNLADWMNDPNNVYIGRRGIVFVDNKRFPPADSLWANPYRLKDYNNDRNMCSLMYESYIRNRIVNENLHSELLMLDGKRLGCWCHPDSCHGDVLIRLIAELKNSL
jgi:hypothetical protein